MNSVAHACSVGVSLALLVCIPGVSQAAGQQRAVLKEADEHSVRVRVTSGVDETSLLELATSNGSLSVRLNEPFVSIEQLRVSPNGTNVALVGSARDATRVLVFNAQTGKPVHGSYGFRPLISPDGNLVVLEVYRTRVDADQSAKYGVIALDSSTSDSSSLVSQAFFPRDRKSHSRQSEFFWVTTNTVAFLDLADDTAALVVVEFRNDGSVERTSTKELETDRFVKRGEVDSTSPPASAIYGANIVRLEGQGLLLRLTFPTSPALRVRRADVHVWE